MIKVLETIKQLRNGDYHILNSIERGMKKYQYVPLSAIFTYSGYTKEDVNFYLNRLLNYKLIEMQKNKFIGYKLKMDGYDCLALNALIKADIIEAFGSKLGVGKEADVYDVLLSNSKERAAVKIHRIGKTSFHNVRRYRNYIEDRRHISWLYISRLSASKEFEALKILHKGGLPVPRPIFHNRHIIVMSFMNGKLLANINYLKTPNKVLNKILDFIYLAFKNFNIIHSDLSEFNIMILNEQKLLIFDFPQWISADHPQYLFYLKRDIFNILNFFRRKFNIIIDKKEIFDKFEI